MPILADDSSRAAALREIRSIAVLGASARTDRPAYYVPQYLHEQGFAIHGVNPQYAGQVLWGHPVAGTLAELAEPVDAIDVFRRPEDLPAHVREILALVPHPRLVWFQRGIVHDGAAHELAAHGMAVVQDACLMVEHRRLGQPGPRRT